MTWKSMTWKSMSQRGFTLLEVMIAMAVFAVVAMAITKSTSTSIEQTRMIEDKTLAYWVAQNELGEMRLSGHKEDSFPATGRRNEKVVLAERDWNLLVAVLDTENPDIRRIEISVYSAAEDEQPLSVLTGFIGKY